MFQESFNKVLFCNFVVAWISSLLPEQKEGLFVWEANSFKKPWVEELGEKQQNFFVYHSFSFYRALRFAPKFWIQIDAICCWLMKTGADLSWLMLIYTDWCWLMLVDAKWCWLMWNNMLIGAYWCWLIPRFYFIESSFSSNFTWAFIRHNLGLI